MSEAAVTIVDRAVVLDDGSVITLFHDLSDGLWYAQRG